jgi:hypothetical protein
MTDHPSDAQRPRYSWSDEDYMFVDCGTLDKDGLGIEARAPPMTRCSLRGRAQ